MAGAHIVRDFSIGNTRIKIADNYCVRNADEVQRILRNIAEQAQRQFSVAASAGKYDEQKREIQENTADGGGNYHCRNSVLCGG